jgi:MoaA/NifB/PqqE/SkfB family radical SAM enzyme
MYRPDYPLIATINVTEYCNLNCIYCFYQPKNNCEISFETFKEIIDDLSEHRLFLLIISGGEPFCHPKINEMLRYANSKIYNTIILSNGTCISNDNLTCIKEIISEKGIFNIQVSIDSVNTLCNDITRGLGTFVLESITKLSKIGANISLSTVITKYNYSNIIETIEHFNGIVKQYHLIPFKDIENNLEKKNELGVTVKELLTLYRNIEDSNIDIFRTIKNPFREKETKFEYETSAPCMSAFSQVVIDPNLDIRPCDRLRKTILGKYANKNIVDIWKNGMCESIYKSSLPYCNTCNNA